MSKSEEQLRQEVEQLRKRVSELEIVEEQCKRTEEALRESEKEYRSTVNDLLVGVVVHASDTSILLSNPEATNILGLTHEQMSGKKTIDPAWSFVHEDSTKMKVEDYPVSKVFSTKKPLHNYVVGVNRPDRDYITWAMVNAIPVFSNDGELEKVVVNFVDITDLMRIEEEKLALERQVQYTQKLESLGVLAGGIAHDFNNLLMGILGNADLALMELTSVAPARENINAIVKAAMRAAELAKQMLAYSGKGQFVIKHMDIQTLIEEMVHLLEVSISKKVIIKYDFAQNVPPIEADATQIRQIIMNLVVNAAEAIGDRSGVISIRTGAMECDRAYLDDTYLENDLVEGTYSYFEVSDTGSGMDEETVTRIFDPFFTKKFSGRGLGLAAVLGIVRGHSGAIKLSSKPGKGTTFKVLFPTSQGPINLSEMSDPGDNKEKFTGKIAMLVDDEETVRVVGRQMLEYLGMEVVTAVDGRHALTLFNEDPDKFYIVVLDLTMPHMDGEETFREMRRVRKDVCVLLSSGYNEQDIIARFASKGFAGFIQKPYQIRTLSAALFKALEKKK